MVGDQEEFVDCVLANFVKLCETMCNIRRSHQPDDDDVKRRMRPTNLGLTNKGSPRWEASDLLINFKTSHEKKKPHPSLQAPAEPSPRPSPDFSQGRLTPICSITHSKYQMTAL